MVKQNGTTLIEVLITVIILAVGLLTIAALQQTSLKNNLNSYMRSEANIVAYDVFERIRIANEATGNFVLPDDDEIKAMIGFLPDGDGDISCTVDRVCTFTVTWGEHGGTNNDGESSTFVYVSRIY